MTMERTTSAAINPRTEPLRSKNPPAIFARDLLRDTVAGVLAAVVLIANIVSFSALMFPGTLSAGMPVAIWAMLIGSSIGGVWIALRTSVPPIATGIDSPTGTVLVLLSASVGSSILAGAAVQPRRFRP